MEKRIARRVMLHLPCVKLQNVLQFPLYMIATVSKIFDVLSLGKLHLRSQLIISKLLDRIWSHKKWNKNNNAKFISYTMHKLMRSAYQTLQNLQLNPFGPCRVRRRTHWKKLVLCKQLKQTKHCWYFCKK